MLKKEWLQLGDIVVLRNGWKYIYTAWRKPGYRNIRRVFLRHNGIFKSSGIEDFDKYLRFGSGGSDHNFDVIKIYRPEQTLVYFDEDPYCFPHVDNFLENAMPVTNDLYKHFIQLPR